MAALNPVGGPKNSTLVMSQQLFTTAFTKGQFGYASAMGVVLAVITLVVRGDGLRGQPADARSGRGGRHESTVGHERHGDDDDVGYGGRCAGRAPYRRPAVDRHVARRPDHLVAPRHRAVALGMHVVVQDQLGDLRLAVRAARRSGASTTTPTAWTTAGIGSSSSTPLSSSSALVIVMAARARCAAYVLARFQFPGNRFIYYLMLAGLTFPIFLAIVPLFFVLRSLGLLNTLPGLILTYAAFALPFTVFFLYSFFRSLPTRSPRRRAGRGGGVADVLPGDAADGQAGPRDGRDPQLPRAVEPVPAPRGAEHQPATTTC